MHTSTGMHGINLHPRETEPLVSLLLQMIYITVDFPGQGFGGTRTLISSIVKATDTEQESVQRQTSYASHGNSTCLYDTVIKARVSFPALCQSSMKTSGERYLSRGPRKGPRQERRPTTYPPKRLVQSATCPPPGRETKQA